MSILTIPANSFQGHELREIEETGRNRPGLIIDGLKLIGHGLKTAERGSGMYI